MDNAREKLVELICKGTVYDRYLDRSRPRGCHGYTADVLADYLIANGVTVQEWISASEPPETKGYYLVAGNLRWNGKPTTREAYWNGDGWLSCDGKCNITRLITRWMTLPQPPKQER